MRRLFRSCWAQPGWNSNRAGVNKARAPRIASGWLPVREYSRFAVSIGWGRVSPAVLDSHAHHWTRSHEECFMSKARGFPVAIVVMVSLWATGCTSHNPEADKTAALDRM